MVTSAPPAAGVTCSGDLLVWHGVSAAAMTAMLVVTLPVWLAGLGMGVFAAGLGWCTVRAVRHRPRAAYLRLGVCCLAMLAMLLPLGGSRALGAGSTAGHSMAGHALSAGPVASGGPGLLALLLAGVLVCLAVAGAARGILGSSAARSRAGGLAEAVVAAGMAAMLVGLV